MFIFRLISGILTLIASLGQNSNSSQNTRIGLTNMNAFAYAVLMMCLGSFFFKHAYATSLYLILTAVAFLLVWVYNYFNQYALAKTWLICMLYEDLFCLTKTMGVSSGVHFIYLALLVIPFLLFTLAE